MARIPKIIHYCWFGGNPLPDLAKKCIDSWKKMCPDYEIKEWNENTININGMNAYVREAYKNKKWAFVTDYIRLYIIYNYGGIYLDTDVELLKNLDVLLDHDSFFGIENNNVVNTGLGFGAAKGNKLVKMLMDDYENVHFILKNGNLDLEPCPIRNTKTLSGIFNKFDDYKKINSYKNNYFYPKEYFCPMDNVTKEINITDNTFSIHYYSGTWLDEKAKKWEQKRKRICDKFGEKNGKRIIKIITLPRRIRNKIKKYGFYGTLKFAVRKVLKTK